MTTDFGSVECGSSPCAGIAGGARLCHFSPVGYGGAAVVFPSNFDPFDLQQIAVQFVTAWALEGKG